MTQITETRPLSPTARTSAPAARKTKVPKARRRHSGGAILTSIVVLLYVLVAVVPILTIFLGSLKTNTQIAADPLSLPWPLQFDNYVRGWNGVAVGESMNTYFINTIIFSIAAVGISTIAGVMGAYAIARKAGAMSSLGERLFVVLYALPFLAVIIPLFSITGTLGLRSNPFGIGVVFAAGWLPLTVVLMYGFFASLPLDVIEAAKTDGASEFRIFWTISMPMSRGPILSTVLLAFIYAWNNLAYTLPLLVDPKSTTIAPGLLLFNSQYSVDTGAQLAGMVISIVPLVLAYALMHKHIMESFRVGSFR